MPVYSYFCGDGHETERLISRNPPDDSECGECGKTAERVLTVSVAKSRPMNTDPCGVIMHNFVCKGCSHRFEKMVAPGEYEDGIGCEKCDDGTAFWAPGTQITTSLRLYPYFDRGLGCEVRSPGHRRDVCKSRGLTPVDGDFDEDQYLNPMEAKIKHELDSYDNYVAELENHPKYRDYRILRDKGFYKDYR